MKKYEIKISKRMALLRAKNCLILEATLRADKRGTIPERINSLMLYELIKDNMIKAIKVQSYIGSYWTEIAE